MAKKLITISNLEKYADHEKKCLLVRRDLILTPGARDKAANLKYRVIYENLMGKEEAIEEKKAEKNTAEKYLEKSDAEKENIPLEHQVLQILRKEYNVVNEFEVQMLARKVMENINNK